VIVGELDLDLEAFEGPFDLLLTLVLKDELPAGDVDVAAIVVEFCERLAERDELDLEACGEFLVLVAGLLELKVRALFGLGEGDDALDLDPDEAAADLAARLADYRRIREAAAWLRERLAEERFFRVGPSALAPAPSRRLAGQDPAALGAALRALAVEPPSVSLSHMALRFPPVSLFLERFRSLLRRRSRFEFDGEVRSLSRVEQAVAFLALLELRKGGEIRIEQAAPFAPVRIHRAHDERTPAWNARSA
jgi:segregation and condensation protein A